MGSEQKQQQNVGAVDAPASTAAAEAKGLEGAGVPLPVNFHGNLRSAQGDQHLKDLLLQAKDSKQTAVVSYGAKWCHACRQMLPTFCNLSNDYPNALFIYTDIDECPDETQDVRYTPTFRFYRGGDKVDEFYGAGPQRLRDRVWLQA
eukprot:c14958_g1_i1 orf=57-497(+)